MEVPVTGSLDVTVVSVQVLAEKQVREINSTGYKIGRGYFFNMEHQSH